MPKLIQPFQEVVGNLCSHAAQDYLILVDCCSVVAWHHSNGSWYYSSPPGNRQSFCCTGVPSIIWSNEGPQFTSTGNFQHLRQQHIHTTTPSKQHQGWSYSEVHEKAHMHFLKRLTSQWGQTLSCLCNTATHHPAKAVSPQHRNSMVGKYKTQFQHILRWAAGSRTGSHT